MNQRRMAILSGSSIVIMAVVAGLIMSMVYNPLLQMNVAEFTEFSTSARSSLVFGVLGWVIILICDLLASYGLYRFYAERDHRKAAIMGSLRLVYSIILLVALVPLFQMLLLYEGDGIDPLQGFSLLHRFESLWQIGLIVFGLHLLYLARFVCVKRGILMVLAVLLFVAGIGYLGSNTADLFVANYEQLRPRIEAPFLLPMVLGELGLAIWLLVRGGRKLTPHHS